MHSRARRAVFAVCTIAGLAIGATAVAPPQPAGAATITLNLSCQSRTPIGTIATTQTITFDATAPAGVEPTAPFTADIVFPAGTVSSSQNGGAARVDYIKDLSYKITVPANATFTGGTLSGGYNYGAGTPTVTLQGSPTSGAILYTIPGPIATDQEFQIPALALHFTASGPTGSTIQLQLGGSSFSDPGFTTTAHVTSPFTGDAATSCYQPPPNPIWTTTTIILDDTTPPTITLVTPADGAQYPQGANVAVAYSCDDGSLSSGVATCVGDLPNGASLDTSTLGTFTFTVQATDNAGNISPPVTNTYSIVPGGNDRTPPSITVTAPADGAVFTAGTPVAASYSCADTESAVATCAGDVADGAPIDTATVGPHTFTVVAEDAAGIPHALTTSYRVVPAPSPQTFTSGDVTNQIPVKCDTVYQTTNKTIPVTANSAPVSAVAGGTFQWAMALGADYIPLLSNGTNLRYTWSAPANGRFVAATLTGPGSQVNGASIAIAGDGTLQLSIASVTDQGGGLTNDTYTPPPFAVTIAVDGPVGSSVTTRFAEFTVTTTVAPLPPTTYRCTGGDPTYQGRTNPTLTTTAVIDGAAPTITVTSPAQGQLVAPGAPLTLSYACADAVTTPSCTGTAADGSALDTSTSGPQQVSVVAVDGAGNRAVIWRTYIVDDPTVDVADATVLEGPGATLDFAVSLSNPSLRSVVVNYSTTDGTAGAPTDYTAVGGALTFAPGGPLTQTVSVPVTDNSAWRGNRTLVLQLVTALRGRLGDAQATGTILDDDPPPVAVSSPKTVEGVGAKLRFSVSLSAAPNVTVSVTYATADGTATAGTRYTAASGTLTFTPSGPLSQPVDVALTNDAIYDETSPIASQTMTLTATTPANGVSATGTGTIVDDEPAPVFASVGSVSLREGDVLNRVAKVVVSLSRASTQTVTVSYVTVAGTAVAPSDYKAKLGLLTFKPGQVSKPVSVTVVGDTRNEGPESFVVRLRTPSNAQLWRSDGIVAITDDDAPSATAAELAIGDASVYEGPAGKYVSVMVPVVLSQRPVGTVSVRWTTTAASATANADYKTRSGTLSFTANQVAKTLTFRVVGDGTPEADETFTVVLSSPAGAAVTAGTGTITIRNDD